MALKIQINKDDFETLDEGVKAHYKQDSANEEVYRLDADYEDVEGLKNKNNQLLADLKKQRDRAKDVPDGFDFQAAIEALDFKNKTEQEQALKRGEFEKLRTAMETNHAKEKQSLMDKLNGVLETNAEKDLTMELVTNGVIPEKAGRMAKLLRLESIKPVHDENGKPAWRSLDDTQTIDLSEFIPSLKEDWSEFFRANVASGGGATGGRVTKSGAELKRSQMSTADKVAYVKEHGQEAFNKLPLN